ncbi:MAG: hypothetical protein ABI812_07060 [Betaproteobacteria bacterium]
MKPAPNHAAARRDALGLTAREFAQLARLRTPQRIQAFVNAIPTNHETDGETALSVREVLRQRRAHCIEGAFVAACALWIRGAPPLVMHLACEPHDDPHVVTLFRNGGNWGAISKSNGVALRHRDAIYRSLRELALSYFHEFCDRRGQRTLRAYSAAFDLRRIDPLRWVTRSGACSDVDEQMAALRHYPLVPALPAGTLWRRDAFERRAAELVEYPPPEPARAARDDQPRRKR